MAILKVMKDSKDISSSIDYCEGLTQTNEPDKCVLKMGYMCDIDNFREDSQLVRDQFGKNNGRQSKHYMLSFAEDELPQTQEGYQKCAEMGFLWAKETFPNNQVGIYVHGNTDNVHCHILVHTVDIETGKKLQVSRNDLRPFKEKANEICNDYGIELILEKDKEQEAEYKNIVSAHKPEKSWTEQLKNKVDEVRLVATSYDDFEKKLNEKGITLERKTFTDYKTKETQNYILITDVSAEKESGKERKAKNTTLGRRFEEDRLEKQFEKNRGVSSQQKQNKNDISLARSNKKSATKTASIPSPINLQLPDDRKEKEEMIDDKKELIDEDTREKLREAKSQEEAERIKKEEQEQKELVSREKEIQQADDQFYARMMFFFNKMNQSYPRSTKFRKEEKSLYMGGATRTKFKLTYEDQEVSFSQRKGDQYETYKALPVQSEEDFVETTKEVEKRSRQQEVYAIQMRQGIERT